MPSSSPSTSPAGSKMSSVKRKRDDLESTEEADTDVAPHNATLSDIAEPGFAVMTVRLGERGTPKLSKAQLREGWGPVHEDTNQPSATPLLPRHGHRVRPVLQWESMKKYKQFVVKDNQFTVGDYIYINNREFEEAESRDNDKQLWVAKVLETRARDGNFVRLRVAYLYWPDELPTGRQTYHGQREMIMSNHMDILDAQCVLDKAEVYHLTEQEQIQDTTPTDDNVIYWRQTYDVTDGKLSSEGLRIDCTCHRPHNPEKLLIQCKNEACGIWNHERCLEDQVLKQEWAGMVNGDMIAVDGAKASTEEPDGSIQVAAEATTPAAEDDAVREDSVLSNSRKKVKLGGRGRKSQAPAEPEAPQEPWKGRLQAQIERKKSDTGNETPEITGRVKIKDLRKESQAMSSHALTCLKCHTPFL